MAPPCARSPRLLAGTSDRRAGWRTFHGPAAVCLAACVCFSVPARAQWTQDQLWGTDGTVTALARSGPTIYVGGAFNMAGPVSGGGVPVARLTGTPVLPFPRVAGVVRAVIPDGAGGWFIGGSFASVGGQPRVNLAHILANGQVADWTPDPDGDVLVLALDGLRLFVGGSFSRIAGQTRRHLAELDAMGGGLSLWDPSPDRPVRALLVHQGALYVGGDFDSVAGQPRSRAAAFELASSALTAWNPDVQVGLCDVRALAALGGTIYIGGLFSSVGGVPRRHLAAVDAMAGLPTSWDPSLTGPDDLFFGDPFVYTLAIKGNTIYVGGHYTGIGGAARNGLAQVDLATGLATSWNPDAVEVTSVAVRETTVFIGGYFLSVGGVRRRYLAEVRVDTGALTAWDPAPNDAVQTMAEAGGILYAGGFFTGIGSEWRPRRNVAAFDAATGRLKDWDPNPDGLIVEALVATHGQIYVGGYFSMIGGQIRYGLASVDTLTGAATAWDPVANSVVGSLAVAGDTLYAGGFFTNMSGQSRGRLASFDLLTGQMTGWNPNAASDVYGLTLQGDTLYVAGFFWTIGGVSRKGVAAVDRTSGSILDWAPQTDDFCRAVAVLGDTVFVGGRFSSIGGQSRRNLAAVDARTGAVLPWQADANSDVGSLALLSDTLFVGGSFAMVGGVARRGLAAVSTSSGSVLPWDPDLSWSEWGGWGTYPTVSTLTLDRHTLYVGGRFGRAGPIPTSNLAGISFVPPPPPPLPLPRALALAALFPNPVRTRATIRFALPAAGSVDLTVFDVQGRRVSSLLRRTAYAAGAHDVPMTAAGWPEGFYFLRLEAGGRAVTRKFVVLE